MPGGCAMQEELTLALCRLTNPRGRPTQGPMLLLMAHIFRGKDVPQERSRAAWEEPLSHRVSSRSLSNHVQARQHESHALIDWHSVDRRRSNKLSEIDIPISL